MNEEMKVYTICLKCRTRFDWTMGVGQEAPDCPTCGFDATGREERRKLRREGQRFEGHSGNVLTAHFSPDGRRIASGGADKVVRVWELATRTQLFSLAGHKDEITAVAFLPDGSKIVSTSGYGTLKLWDPETKQECATLIGHGSLVRCVDVSPDGKTIMSGGSTPDATIKFWDVESLKERFSLSMSARVNSVCCSPDGRFVAAAINNGTCVILDAQSGATIRSVVQPGNQVTSVAFSPDSKLLASTDVNVIRLWDVATGNCQTKLVADDKGMDHAAYAVAFAPDGTTLVAVGGSSVRLWDLQSMKRRKTLPARTNNLIAVAFMPFDASVFVTTGVDGSVQVRSVEEQGMPGPGTTDAAPLAVTKVDEKKVDEKKAPLPGPAPLAKPKATRPTEAKGGQPKPAETQKKAVPQEKKWWEFWK